MFIEVRPDINVGLLDGVEDELGHASPFPAQQVRLEQSLASSEPLVIHLTQSVKYEIGDDNCTLITLPSGRVYFSTKNVVSRASFCSEWML